MSDIYNYFKVVRYFFDDDHNKHYVSSNGNIPKGGEVHYIPHEVTRPVWGRLFVFDTLYHARFYSMTFWNAVNRAQLEIWHCTSPVKGLRVHRRLVAFFNSDTPDIIREFWRQGVRSFSHSIFPPEGTISVPELTLTSVVTTHELQEFDWAKPINEQ